jgi:hypothetical protein
VFVFYSVVEMSWAVLASMGILGVEMQRVIPLMCTNAPGSFSWMKQYITHLWSKVGVNSLLLTLTSHRGDTFFLLQHVITPCLMARKLQPEMHMTYRMLDGLQDLCTMKDPSTGESLRLIHGYR